MGSLNPSSSSYQSSHFPENISKRVFVPRVRILLKVGNSLQNGDRWMKGLVDHRLKSRVSYPHGFHSKGSNRMVVVKVGNVDKQRAVIRVGPR